VGLGFEVLELGFEVLRLGFEVSGLGFEVLGLGFDVLGLGFEVLGLGFEVLGQGFETLKLGFEVLGCFGGQLVFRLAESCFGGGSENSYWHDQKTFHFLCFGALAAKWLFGWLNRVLGAAPKTAIPTTKKPVIIDVSVLWRPVDLSAG
jgi:hypothetical protein